ncbi:MAG: twin transmembrane helix small protein [Methylococcaceae bacterium]|jgi:Trk-type K+ transport system membrane component
MIKILVIIAFIIIIGSLGSALLYLITNKAKDPSPKIVKALTFRITLSVILFVFVFIAIALGWIQPHGIGSKLHMKVPSTVEHNN